MSSKMKSEIESLLFLFLIRFQDQVLCSGNTNRIILLWPTSIVFMSMITRIKQLGSLNAPLLSLGNTSIICSKWILSSFIYTEWTTRIKTYTGTKRVLLCSASKMNSFCFTIQKLNNTTVKKQFSKTIKPFHPSWSYRFFWQKVLNNSKGECFSFEVKIYDVLLT